MNIEQWLQHLSKAYQAMGESLTEEKKQILLAEISGESPQHMKTVAAEAYNIMFSYFFKIAAKGTPFGDLSRVQERFGSSLEVNYGLSSGPFIDMAKTYWTYKLEVLDLFPAHSNLALSQVLGKVEGDVASVFFPTPGPMSIPVQHRIKTQKELLREFAPEIDIEAFISQNPILKVEASRSGCLGTAILFLTMGGAIGLFAIYLFFAFLR